MVPSTRTRTCMDGSSGLTKLNCTPAQHIVMLAESTSRGGAVTLGGATQGGGGEIKWSYQMPILATVIQSALSTSAHREQSCHLYILCVHKCP